MKSGSAKIRTVALETRIAKAIVVGLIPGQTTYFRFRALTRAGKGDPSQIVSLIVH